MSRPTTTLRHGARRLATLAVAGAAALSVALVPTSASAWDDDELPDYGIPWGFVQDLNIPRTIAGLADIAESCPAPEMPAAQDADGASGYRMPVRIRLDNATLLAGYTPEAATQDQGIPYGTVSGLKGWVVAYVDLPAMTLSVQPDDVELCTGWAAYTVAVFGRPKQKAAMLAAAQEFDNKFIPIPGTLLPYNGSPSDPDRRLKLKNFVAASVEAAVSGVNPDGSLEIEQTLALTGDLTQEAQTSPAPPGSEFTCPISASPAASTAPKTLRAPDDSLTYGGKPVGVPPAPDKVYLPTKPLSGAVEGGTATVGANRFSVTLSGGSLLCKTAILQAVYGFDPTGAVYAFKRGASPFGSSAKPFPIADGLLDLSVDLTVDKIGLPKGLPEGYGFR